MKQHDKNKQRTRRHRHLLRGILHSVDADSRCWAETNNSKKLSYYRSRKKLNGSQIYYNSRVVEEQLPDIFKSVTITEKPRQGLRKALGDFFSAEVDGDEELMTCPP